MSQGFNAAYSLEQAITMWAGNIPVHPLVNMGPERQNMQLVEPVADAPPFTPDLVYRTDYERLLYIAEEQNMLAAALLENHAFALTVDDSLSMEVEESHDFPAGSNPEWIDRKIFQN